MLSNPLVWWDQVICLRSVTPWRAGVGYGGGRTHPHEQGRRRRYIYIEERERERERELGRGECVCVCEEKSDHLEHIVTHDTSVGSSDRTNLSATGASVC